MRATLARRALAPQALVWRAGRRRLSTRAAMAGSAVPAVVTPQWLSDRLSDPGVRVLDASWYLPPMGRSATEEYAADRIPGAAFFDVDGIALPGSDLPHMLPTEAQFGAAMDALGVRNDTTVVVYDGMGMFAAPRAWWTLRIFGHDRVAVLEGGLPAWKAAGLPTDQVLPPEGALEAGAAAVRAAAAGQAPAPTYKARLQTDKVRSLAQMLDIVGGRCQGEQVLDARAAGRFAGRDPEPRAGMRGGHMPGARNVPFTQVYQGGAMTGARLLPPQQLAAVFAGAGVDVAAPLVCSCGSGLTAAVLALALHQITGKLVPLYDGSWSEWGAREDTPIDKEA